MTPQPVSLASVYVPLSIIHLQSYDLMLTKLFRYRVAPLQFLADERCCVNAEAFFLVLLLISFGDFQA